VTIVALKQSLRPSYQVKTYSNARSRLGANTIGMQSDQGQGNHLAIITSRFPGKSGLDFSRSDWVALMHLACQYENIFLPAVLPESQKTPHC